MNIDTKIRSHGAAVFIRKISVLFVLSAVAYFAQTFFEEFVGPRFLFSLNHFGKGEILYQLGTLPLFCVAIVAIQRGCQRFSKLIQQSVLVATYLAVYSLLSPQLLLSGVFVMSLTALFFLEKIVPRKGVVQLLFFVFVGLFFLYLPVALYLAKTKLEPEQFYLLLVFKTCLMMRLVSWLADRRLYRRTEYGSVLDFLEFIFCPIFFIFPGQIQYFIFNYFHTSKKPIEADGDYLRVFVMGAWGIALMLIYSLADMFFWKRIAMNAPPVSGFDFVLRHLGYGAYWLGVVYVQQTAGMAFQVCLGRVLGYQIKYDMHFPLTARSPIDYLRRHSSYVRDYIVETGFRPMSLFFLRRGWSPAVVSPLAAILSYALLIIPQTGYRADYDRPLAMSLAMLGSLTVFIILPSIGNLKFRVFGQPRASQETLASPMGLKPMGEWRAADFAAWIGTLLMLVLSKAALGLASIFGR